MPNKARVSVPVQKLIIVTGDHGGYKEGWCVVCTAHGWLGKIKHKPGCAVAKNLPKEEEALL